MDLIFDVSGLTGEEEEVFHIQKGCAEISEDNRCGHQFHFIYSRKNLHQQFKDFQRFSRKREATFKKQYPEIEVVRNKLFQKICAKSSKHLAVGDQAQFKNTNA